MIRQQQKNKQTRIKIISSLPLSIMWSNFLFFFLFQTEGEDGDKEVSHQNPGMIASYYYIRTGTVDIFSQAITSKRKLKGLLDILCNAIEFEDIPVRQNEDYILERLAKKLPKKISSPDWLSSATKAHVTPPLIFITTNIVFHFFRQKLNTRNMHTYMTICEFSEMCTDESVYKFENLYMSKNVHNLENLCEMNVGQVLFNRSRTHLTFLRHEVNNRFFL
jgi:hypothetical protein